MYINEIAINVVCVFKRYPYIVCDDNKTLWQVEHFYRKRVKPLKKLTYNAQRKAYRINSLWVSKKNLHNLKTDCNYKIIIQHAQHYPF